MSAPTLKLDLDYNVIRAVLIAQMMLVTGLDQNHVEEVEPEVPNQPRPTLPYMGLKIIVPGARFGDDDKRNIPDKNGNPTDNWNSGGPRMMSVSFKSYGTSHEEAYNLMALWQSALDEENTQAALRASGIGVWTIGAVADLSQLVNTAYEGRAQLDVTFGLAANVTSNLGEIDTVPVTGTVSTDQGTTGNISETVEI